MTDCDGTEVLERWAVAQYGTDVPGDSLTVVLDDDFPAVPTVRIVHAKGHVRTVDLSDELGPTIRFLLDCRGPG